MGKRKSIEMVRDEFKSVGYTLLETEYKTRRKPLRYVCERHPDKTSTTTYDDFSRGRRCAHCKYDEKRLPICKVKEIFSDKGCTLVSKEYKNNSTPLEYTCLKHPEVIQTITLSNLGKREACHICNRMEQSKNLTGENHHNWKGGKSTEAQRARQTKAYANWRKRVFSRDKYTCQCCGDSSGSNLEAHHIENFSNNIESRYEVDNGITMCKACHNSAYEGSYHNIYGTYNNSFQQLDGYFQSKGAYLKGVFCVEENLKGVLEKWQEA